MKFKEELCHIECLNKTWELQEKDTFEWRETPHIKKFSCLAEARKGLITYTKNPDFQNIQFRLRRAKT